VEHLCEEAIWFESAKCTLKTEYHFVYKQVNNENEIEKNTKKNKVFFRLIRVRYNFIVKPRKPEEKIH
jgi:hypothetical protein